MRRPSRRIDAAANLDGLPDSLTPDSWLLENQIRHFGLLDLQVRLRLEHFLHLQAICLLVALGAWRPDGGTARGVEQAELNADGVGDLTHDAAEGVDFADKVSFGDAADGGIAGHLRDQVDIEREQCCLQSHARRGHGSLTAGMSGADDDQVELFCKSHSIATGERFPLLLPFYQ